MRRIYFDNAATTPVDQRVLKAMEPYFSDIFGNPSSLHSFGQEAHEAVETARNQASHFLGATSEEIVFTSGATESDNLALQGLARNFSPKNGGRIIISAIEHPAVSETGQALKKDGYEIVEIPVDHEGLIRLDELKKAITPETFLVSVMYVNNEIGSLQPISEIGEYLSKINSERNEKSLGRIYFHTDAVQAVNLFDCHVDKLRVDLLSLSGHKIYGPKGIGALYVRKGTPLKPIQFGGHQERGLKPGTINTPMIVGLGKALELVESLQKKDFTRMKILSDKVTEFVLKNIPGVMLNGSRINKSPGHINFTFENVEGESLLLMLDSLGISVSTGSACASGTLSGSSTLKAIGLNDEASHGSIRLSFGRINTLQEVRYFIEVLPGVIKKIRARSPIKN